MSRLQTPMYPRGALMRFEPFFNFIRTKLFERLQVQRIAYAATVTPDATAGEYVVIDTLTGNITVANPVNAREGMRLQFQFVQDATGTRTVTFGSDFLASWTPSTAASKANTIAFVYDGTQWVQIASVTGL